MDQSTESGDVSIRNLGGLNQRVSPLDLPPNEFSVLEGYYPSQQGLLSRIPGKEKLFQLEGRVMSIHPTYNSSGHVLIQTTENLYLTTIDEIQGRVPTTSLTLNPNPDPGGASSGDTTPPTDPTSLVVSGVTQGTLLLSWTASFDVVGVTSYSIYYRSGGSGSYTLLTTAISTQQAVTSLTASTQYEFYVVANDAAGNVSGASNIVDITTLGSGGDVTPPTAPTLLITVLTTTTSVTLSWGASTDAVGVTGYIIYQRLGSSGSFGSAGTSVGTSFLVNGLTTDTEYNFQVKAFDAAGNISSASNTLSVITGGGVAPSPVATEILIYYVADAGVDGIDATGANPTYVVSNVSIPNGKSSFLISVGSSFVQLPAGTYMFDAICQSYTTATGATFYHKTAQSATAGSFPASNTVTSPSTNLMRTTRSLGVVVLTAPSQYVVYAFPSSPSTTKLGKFVNLGSGETYMILKITKLL